jgi:hypothetical protein
MELLLYTEQVASLHRSVTFCESEGRDTALFVGMGDFPVTFFVSGCISVQENHSQFRYSMWGVAPIEFNLNLIILSLFTSHNNPSKTKIQLNYF